MQFETDRARFIGRGNSLRQPARAAEPLTGTVGTVLDPIFSIRRRVSIPGGGMARVTFWTLIADAPDKLLDLVDRHRDPSAFERAETLAWTQVQVQLRHLGISRATALEFQQLSGMLLRGDPRLRAAPARIASGLGPQSGLWHMGISGDLPIVLILIDEAEDLSAVREALNAHEYWRMRQFAVDLVILNDRASSYVQDLQIGIEAAIRAAQSRPRTAGHDRVAQGAVHAVRADLITPEAKALLLAVAGAVLVAGRGGIGAQQCRGGLVAPAIHGVDALSVGDVMQALVDAQLLPPGARDRPVDELWAELPVGAAVAAVAFGAVVIEKHFTESRAEGGVDSAFSLEPAEFAQLRIESERAWQALGAPSFGMSVAETASMRYRRSLYIVEDLKAGDVLTAADNWHPDPSTGAEAAAPGRKPGLRSNMSTGITVNAARIMKVFRCPR